MKVMNIYVLFSLLFFSVPGGCPIYSIDLAILEVPNEFQNELKLQSMLSSELHQSRHKLNTNEATVHRHVQHVHSRGYRNRNDELDRRELLRSIEDRIKASHYAAASAEHTGFYRSIPEKRQKIKVLRSANNDVEFVGTNLFGNHAKKCFSSEDIALLSARQDFETLVPKSYPHSLLSDSIVYTLMKYFNSVNQVVREMSDNDTKNLLQRAFYDALGGYLRYYLLPVAQVSYYAGRLKLCTVDRLVALYRQCRMQLNTNGNGWRTPVQDVLSQLKCVNIKPLIMNEGRCTEKDAANCALLDQNCLDDNERNEQMLVPLPHLESEDVNGFLSNIFLPFKQQQIYNLRSPDAAFIVVKFYKTLSSCYRFQGMNPRPYNQKLRNWIRENLQVHYRDEMFYPGLGGVLQVYESLGCMTPTQLQNELKDQDLNENSSRNYIVGSESGSIEHNVSKVDKEHFKSNKQNDESDKQKVESIKQSRSLRLQPNDADDQNNDNNEASSDASEHKSHDSSKDEECADCTDEAYVGYIAAILALFLIILLLLICCCLHRHKKERPSPKENKENNEQPLAVQNENKIPSQRNKKNSHWNSMFGSKKYYSGSGQKIKNQLTAGLGVVETRYSREYDLETVNVHNANDNMYDADPMSSTSSLGCQFRRKIIPMKKFREKSEEYYAKVDKRRAQKKPWTASERIEDEYASPIVTENPLSIEDRIRNGCKMDERRLTSGQERVSYDTDSNRCSDECRGESMKFKRSETSSAKEPRKSLVLNNSSSSTTNVALLSGHNRQPHIEETKTLPQPSTSRSSETGEPSKYAASWETTFDEESK